MDLSKWKQKRVEKESAHDEQTTAAKKKIYKGIRSIQMCSRLNCDCGEKTNALRDEKQRNRRKQKLNENKKNGEEEKSDLWLLVWCAFIFLFLLRCVAGAGHFLLCCRSVRFGQPIHFYFFGIFFPPPNFHSLRLAHANSLVFVRLHAMPGIYSPMQWFLAHITAVRLFLFLSTLFYLLFFACRQSERWND